MPAAFFTRLAPLALAVGGLLLACNSTDPGPRGTRSVKGTVFHQGKVVAAARVSLDGAAGMRTETDAQGAFEFANVSVGNHTLEVEKQLPTGQLLSQSRPMVIFGDTLLGALELPLPPSLRDIPATPYTPVSLSWSAFEDAGRFREYKLFRKRDPGLDENHGDLIYVGTRLSDTTFLDKLGSEEATWYYRLYVMDNFGKVGGSNIVQHEVPFDMGKVFANYSFELGARDWFLYDASKMIIWSNFVDEEHYWLAAIDSTQSFEGGKSLRLTFGKGRSLVYGGQYTASESGLNGLQPNKTYTTSFRIKHASCKDTELHIWLASESGDSEYWLGKAKTEGTDLEWRKVEAEFTTGPDVNNEPLRFQINFGRFGAEEYESPEHLHDTVWVDDIRVQARK